MTGLGPNIAAGQVLVAGYEGPVEPTLEALRRGELGGVIHFKRNLGTLEEVAALNARIVAAAPADCPAIVAVDQEGGRVARLGSPVLPLPPARKLAGFGPSIIERAAELLGGQLAALGFNTDFAPVLDVDTNPANPIIGDRAFGATPEDVVLAALPFARGLAKAGVIACGKHFPGHGDTAVDSHLALPRVSGDRARIDRIELAPFRAAAPLPMLMTAHVVFDALDPSTPATLSRRVVHDLLRVEMGYAGVIVSDDLEMQAILDHHGVGDAACMAIEAGCDLLLVCRRAELVAEAHEALTRRAERDAAFATRLEDAAQRGLTLRRAHRIEPLATSAVRAAIDTPEARALAAELSR